MNTKVNMIDSDLLIIGAGAAGLWAAHRFSELAPTKKITIVDKGPNKWGGLMRMAGGDFEAVLPPDTAREWLEDTVYYFDGLCDQPLIEFIFSESAARMKDYENFGCEFLHKPDGTLKSVPQRGLPHFKLFPARQKGQGGELMVKSLVARLQKPEIKSFGRIMLDRFLLKNNRVCGAVGFDSINGDFYIFRAQAVIAAVGMGGWKTSYGKNTPTGEGLLMAWNAGCELQDFEFSRVWNMPKLFAWEGQTHLFPLGARFKNRLGENFMAKYSPVLGPNTDPHYTTIGMAMEIAAGRGPIIFDVSPVKQEDMALLKPQTGWQKLNYDKLCKLGMDFFKDDTEWVPQMTVNYGAICADISGKTKVDGLFATGTARSIEPGVYAGGFALMSCAVTGHATGEAAFKWLADNETNLPNFSNAEIESLADQIFEPMQKKRSKNVKEVLTKLQAAVFPYDVSIIKHGVALQKALEKVERISQEDVPDMKAKDPHELLKLREVEAITFVSRLYLLASLERKETRAGHCRSDYPKRDPNGPAWLIVTRNTKGEPELVWKPLPLDQYPVPVTKYYQDNFNFGQYGLDDKA